MKSDLLNEAHELPLVVRPSSISEAGLDILLQWLVAERDWMEKQLLQYGAILLRGFEMQTPADFERFCHSIDQRLLDYAGGDSPREAVYGKVYTSTEYPAELEIPLHNELSYRQRWPRKLFFFCQQPAQYGGETNIADSRRILAEIDPAVRQHFAENQVAYVQNLHDGWGFGKSWQ
ncbi:MAG: TauD/TfdA family dioxygenase, partial [Gammaproteobacteria bacterium]